MKSKILPQLPPDSKVKILGMVPRGKKNYNYLVECQCGIQEVIQKKYLKSRAEFGCMPCKRGPCQICGNRILRKHNKVKTCSPQCSNILKENLTINWRKNNPEVVREIRKKAKDKRLANPIKRAKDKLCNLKATRKYRSTRNLRSMLLQLTDLKERNSK